MVAVIFLLTVVTAIGISLLLPKKYTATASLIVDQTRPDPLAAAIYWSNPSPAFMSTQVDVVKSDRVAAHAIRKLKLTENEEFREEWLKSAQGKGDIETWLVDKLQKMMDVAPARDSNVITVAFEAPTPEFAALLANTFAQSYMDVSLELRVDPAKQYSTFFDARAKELRGNVEAAQARLTAFQRERGVVIADDRFDVEMMRLNELSSQLTALQAISAESSSRQVQAQGGSADRMQEVLNSPVLLALRSDLARAEGRLQELNSRLGENHPQVLETKASIASLRGRIDVETRRVTGSVSVANTINRQREAEIRAALEAQRAKVVRMKSVRDEGLVLLRDVENAQKAYDNMLNRLSQATMESRATLSSANMLTEATPPLSPSSPKLFVNAAMSIIVGLVLALGAAVLLEFGDPRVRTPYEASTLIEVPLLGVLPKPGGSGTFAARRTPLVMPKMIGRLAAPRKEA
jgi:chain length determinant protein EpsF